MTSPGEDAQQRLARIEAKQDELLSELKWLVHHQAALDARLARVEDSMVFQTLRAIGRFYQTRIARRKAGESRGYAEWRGRAGMDAPPFPPATKQPSISLLVVLRHTKRETLERTIRSIRAQTYPRWELITVSEGATPDWAEEVLSGFKSAPSESAARDLATGEWIGTIGEGDFLSPVALEHFAAAARDGVDLGVDLGIDVGIDLIYSDEDVVDAAGSPLRPIFKPDWSPVLLRSVPYTGGLSLLRAGLKGEPAQAVHIAKILYHSSGRTLPPPRQVAKSLRATPLVSIIICTRTSALLERCLNGVRSKTDYAAKETVVVQHTNSTDAAEERAVAETIERFGARRVAFAEPFNFSEMNNRGARAATGEILLFLNDDVAPLEPDWLTRLVGQLEDSSVGAAGAKLLFPNGTIQHAGIVTWLIDGAGHPGRHLFHSENWPWLPYTREVTAVTGACLCIRRADFERLGGFDPVFPVNYNDVDLCLRLREAGLSVIVDMNAVLQHDESQTRRTGTRYDERRLFHRRWANIADRVDPYYSPHLAQNNENLSLR